MEMRPAREMANRMKKMLIHDKIGVDDGFLRALNNDIYRTLEDYFCISNDVKIEVDPKEDGNYSVSICATATKIKNFNTTKI